MKFTILLFAILMCLLVGTLARPDAALEENNLLSLKEELTRNIIERAKRSAESGSQENGNPNGSYAAVANTMISISNRISELLGQIGSMAGIPAVRELLSTLPEMLRGNIDLDEVAEMFSIDNVNRFLQQLNPMNEMLMNIPWIADAYESALQMIAAPLAMIASILATMTTMVGRAMSTISAMTPQLLP